MVLTDNTRGNLENLIENTITAVPQLVELGRNESFRKEFNIREEGDLTLGIVWGYIIRGFQDSFVLDYNRLPNDLELLDMMTVVFKRTREIKEAIFKCG